MYSTNQSIQDYIQDWICNLESRIISGPSSRGALYYLWFLGPSRSCWQRYNLTTHLKWHICVSFLYRLLLPVLGFRRSHNYPINKAIVCPPQRHTAAGLHWLRGGPAVDLCLVLASTSLLSGPKTHEAELGNVWFHNGQGFLLLSHDGISKPVTASKICPWENLTFPHTPIST